MEILIAILALSFLIIVHEFGHFIVAKLSGIKVLEFSLFMGPKLFSVQRGETMYSVRLVPLGGFVRMEGEEQASDDARAFNKKPILTRAAVIAAGPIMNLIIAVLLFAIVFFANGYNTNILGTVEDKSPASAAGLRPNDKLLSYDGKKVYDIMDLTLFLYASKGKPADIEVVRDGQTIKTAIVPDIYQEQTRYLLGFTPKASEGQDSNVVASVTAKSPAAGIGLKENDRIVRINNKAISTRLEINEYLNANQSNPVVVTVVRDGKEMTLGTATPVSQKIPEQYILGVDFQSARGGVGDVVKQAFVSSYSTTRQMYYSLLWLIQGKVSAKNMMGPVGIVSSIGEVVQQSPGISYAILNLLRFTALISINLGVFNLIPFPALDGSKLLLLAVEGIRRRPIPPEKEAAITMVGFVLLIMLMIFTTSNDILRIFQKG